MLEKVLMIGFGAIGLEVTRHLDGYVNAQICQIMVRPGRENEVREQLGTDIQVISSINAVDPMPDFVLGCASHEAVSQYGPFFLEKGFILALFQSVRFLILKFLIPFKHPVVPEMLSFAYCRALLGVWMLCQRLRPRVLTKSLIFPENHL